MRIPLSKCSLERLKKDVAKAVAVFSKDTKDISAREKNMDITMTTHKQKLLEFTRCPNGVMVTAVDYYKGLQMGNARSHVAIQYDIKAAVDHDVMGVWRMVVQDKFDMIWTEFSARPSALMKNSIGSTGGEDGTGAAEDDTSGDNHRVCTSSLKAIIRPELSDHLETIVDLLDRQQEAASELADDIYSLVHKGTLIVSTRFFTVNSPLNLVLPKANIPFFRFALLGGERRTVQHWCPAI
jgi:hypothetical protein